MRTESIFIFFLTLVSMIFITVNFIISSTISFSLYFFFILSNAELLTLFLALIASHEFFFFRNSFNTYNEIYVFNHYEHRYKNSDMQVFVKTITSKALPLTGISMHNLVLMSWTCLSQNLPDVFYKLCR